MPKKQIQFSLDFILNNVSTVCTVKQFDNVIFNITPLGKGVPYNPKSMTCKLFVGVNEDLFMQVKDITLSENKINIILDKNILQNEGTAYAELELSDSEGVITSSSFIFNINSKIGEGANIPGSIDGFVVKYEKLISEFKTQINNAVLDSQNRTTSTIATFNTNANNKLDDVEKRFQTLTISKQQDAEVIDARDNEISLKVRLDRDLAKGKIINENVEGSYITVNDSIGGSISNIEIVGNTIQDTVDLKDIQSVGTLREDGLYKMSILSCGKNLFDGKYEKDKYINSQGIVATGTDWCATDFIKVKPSTKYIQNFPINSSTATYVCFYDINKNFISGLNLDLAYTTPANCYYIRTSWKYSTHGFNFQLEEGTVATTYEPYQYNKSSILLPCQLEKVGDIADRLFRREDGVWCIEKNIGEVVFDGSSDENWELSKINTNTNRFSINISNVLANTLSFMSNKFPNTSDIFSEVESCIIKSQFSIFILKSKLSSQDVAGLKTWLSQNPTLVKYQLATPKTIELPLDTQIQLNSYLGITNIFTEDTVIEPTIKATVPKSLGASIQSLNNKTDILSDRVEAVEKLKEGTELEVTTDKGYIVCENTNNGQIEDLKIEGNTLVNKFINGTFSDNGSRLLQVNTNTNMQGLVTFVPCINNRKVTLDINKISDGSFIRVVNCTQPTLITLANDEYIKQVYSQYTDGWSALDSTMYKKHLILEGDHTQNPPDYFEGLKSVGEDVDKIEVLSHTNGNMLDLNNVTKGYYINKLNIKYQDTNSFYCNYLIEISPKMNIYPRNEGNIQVGIYRYYDVNKEFISGEELNTNVKLNIPNNAKYLGISFYDRLSIINSLYVGTGETKLNTPYQNNKKQILYQTKSGIYEKPILRSTGNVSDTIEKHSDGKYYLHKRCGEVVLNGTKDWTQGINTSSTTNWFYLPFNEGLGNSITVTWIADKIKCEPSTVLLSKYNQGLDFTSIGINGANNFELVISKSKLNTQNAEGLKTWLSQNPTTVVYQLAKEEIYEVVNLDLNSYEGETSVIIDSGAISPRLSFKIASHIGSTISVLKDKINYLEDKVITMFKNILAGDVQTLAYELYPEDFRSEIIEEETIEGTDLL